MSDTVLGVIVLAIFLVLVFGAGLALNKIKNARFHRDWAPLAPLIDGKIEDDGGGAASSWLTGSYQGHPVFARMTPGRKLHEDALPFNDFAMGIRDAKGTHDWQFTFRGSGTPPWQVTAGSTALAQRLERADIPNRLPGLGYPAISFSRNTGLLEYQVNITPAIVPTPDLFVRTLDFLVWLEGVNRQANTNA